LSYSLARPAEAGREESISSGAKVLNFQALQPTPTASTTEARPTPHVPTDDPLANPYDTEPEPADARAVEMSRRTEAIHALLAVAKMPERARLFVLMLVARSDGQETVAAGDDGLVSNVPHSNRKMKTTSRSDVGAKQWLKRARKDLNASQKELEIELVAITKNLYRERRDRTRFLVGPMQYTLNVLKLADEVLSIIPESGLERTRPTWFDPNIPDDDRQQMEADEARDRAAARADLFKKAAEAVIRSNKGKFKPHQTMPRPSNMRTEVLADLKRIATLERNILRKLTHSRPSIRMTGPEFKEKLYEIRELTERLQSRHTDEPKKGERVI
jgi:hypothetical protein